MSRLLMTESYTDGLIFSLGEGHHRRRKREILREGRGIKGGNKDSRRRRKNSPAAWQAFQYCYLQMHDVP